MMERQCPDRETNRERERERGYITRGKRERTNERK